MPKQTPEIKTMRSNLWSFPGLINKSDIQGAYELGAINQRERARLMNKNDRVIK